MNKKVDTTDKMKSFLSSQMVDVSEGRQDYNEAKAVCNYAQQIYNLASLELKKAIASERHSGLSVDVIRLSGGK